MIQFFFFSFPNFLSLSMSCRYPVDIPVNIPVGISWKAHCIIPLVPRILPYHAGFILI